MLTGYRICLSQEGNAKSRPEWAYRLYASLLEQAPQEFAIAAHEDSVTPVSQYLDIQNGSLVWHVNLIGNRAETMLSPLLEERKEYLLEKDKVHLLVTGVAKESIPDVQTLLLMGAAHSSEHRLAFRTATAFKSQGKYLNLPTTRLILQSLIRKWNGSITECPIEDEDDEGMEAMAAGIRCKQFQIYDRLYYLKGNSIPGFVGEITLDNRLNGFQRDLANALLIMAGFSGIGIKTTLGMGGVESRKSGQYRKGK